ncbi:LysR family transcriptional regulator [Trinickia mobilis]|uniref:LysR family transcriptional regulator n=1 Tax=Trinickia mobilis TaxID=2816356 RepID=UPI001A8F741E|nr:LysR family transcriptional regulator [Trinickia mobilis]
MDTLRNMRIFVEVAETSSFTAAARQLDTSTGFVSRSVSELESHLRTRLLNRTTRRLALTEAGERYLVRCQGILASIDAAEAEASDARAKPVGVLRVHAMACIGQSYVVPAVAAYLEHYPSVNVDLTLSQNVPDLLEDGYDVALRLTPNTLPDSNYISHKLGVVDSVLCAAPRYLELHGKPSSVADLSNHKCLQVALPILPSDRWVLVGPNGVDEYRLPDGRFKVNVSDAMAVALQEGMGIGPLTMKAVRSSLRNGSLVRVLPEYRLQELNLYAVYASRQYLDAKIKTWVEFLRGWIADALNTDELGIGNEQVEA